MQLKGNKSGKYSRTQLFGNLVRYYKLAQSAHINIDVYNRLSARFGHSKRKNIARPVMVDIEHNNMLYHISRFEPVYSIQDDGNKILDFHLYTSEIVDGKSPAWWNLAHGGVLSFGGYVSPEYLSLNSYQALNISQRQQAFANLGLVVKYVSYAECNTFMSDERMDEIYTADAIICNDAPDTTSFNGLFIANGNPDYPPSRDFIKFKDNGSVLMFRLRANKLSIAASRINDNTRVSYATAQNLSETQKNTARTNISAMADTPSGDPMHYMYEQAGAVWNAATGYWELNGLTDLTTAEMRQIYAAAHYLGNAPEAGEWYAATIRTNICNFKNVGSAAIDFIFHNAKNIEIIKLGSACNVASFESAFNNCSALKRILSQLNITRIVSYKNVFAGCENLEQVNINALNGNVSFADSPKLSIETGVFFITHVSSTATGIVATLHAAAYERFIADPTIQAALAAHTNITLAAAGSTAVASAAAPARMMSLRAAPLLVTEPEIADGQLVAPAGMFITQAADVADSERLYFTRKTWNVDDDISIWRAAAVSECVEWQARMAAEDDAMVINN